MQVFIIINIVKLLISIAIMYMSYNFVNLDSDYIIGVGTMGVGIFLFLRSLSFFVVLLILKFVSKKSNIALISYKYTGLFALFILVNFLLISFRFWNKRIGIVLLLMFLVLGIII